MKLKIVLEIYTILVVDGSLEHSEYCINMLGKNYKTFTCFVDKCKTIKFDCTNETAYA